MREVVSYLKCEELLVNRETFQSIFESLDELFCHNPKLTSCVVHRLSNPLVFGLVTVQGLRFSVGSLLLN